MKQYDFPSKVKFNPAEFISQADFSVGAYDSIGDLSYTSLPDDVLTFMGRLSLPLGSGSFAGSVRIDRNSLWMPLGHTDLYPFPAGTCAKSVKGAAFYAGGLSHLSIDTAYEFPDDMKASSDYYSGTFKLTGKDFEVLLFADTQADSMFIVIDDRRETPSPFSVRLKSIHPDREETAAHLEITERKVKDLCAVLTETFTEHCPYRDTYRDYYNAGATAVCVSGAEGEIFTSLANDVDFVRIECRYNRKCRRTKPVVICIGAAVSDSEKIDVSAEAVKNARKCDAAPYTDYLAKTKAWFAEYWSKSFIQLDTNYEWLKASTVMWIRLLYMFALTKRGKYPPLHQANPLVDNTYVHDWGSRHWWYNQSRYEYGMFTIGHPELNEPLFNMIDCAMQTFKDHAKQCFAANDDSFAIADTFTHEGYFIAPSRFDKEMSDLYLYGKNPSDELIEYMCHYNSDTSMNGIFNEHLRVLGSFTMKMLAAGADIADFYRQKYLYTLDENYLRNKAYPMLRGIAEFYRSSPVLHKEADGKYHVYPTNYAETFWGATDVIDDVSIITSIMPIVAAYAERLGVDADSIPKWLEIAENMCPIPTTDMPDCLSPRIHKDGKRAFAMCREPCMVPPALARGEDYPGTACDEQIRPVVNFDYVTLESPDNELKELCMNTLEAHLVLQQMDENRWVEMDDCLRFSVNCARLGRADLAWRHMIYQFSRVVASGKYDSEKKDYPDAFKGLKGRAVFDQQNWSYPEGIAEQLFGCCAKDGTQLESVVHIAPAWNMDFDASFMLDARGGFTVAAQIKDGKVAVVEVLSKLGGNFHIRNPFGGECLVQSGDENVFETNSDLISFATQKGCAYSLVPGKA